MKITSKIYNEIISTLPTGYETGGVLGSSDGIITEVIFDLQKKSLSPCCYVPDVDLLNNGIEKWQDGGIEFCGLFHSHLGTLDKLTDADKQYAKDILLAVKDYVSIIFFPIVIPNKRIISFTVELHNDSLLINEDLIEFVTVG